MVAASVSVTTIPSEARFFGADVVLYRGASGRPVMLEAYCPHMGAHLAVGASGATALHGVQVEGDMIRCPNNGWRFGPDGRCNQRSEELRVGKECVSPCRYWWVKSS